MRRSELEQGASRKQPASQQPPLQGDSSSSRVPQDPNTPPQKAPVTRMSDFDFHLQHVGSPPPEHSPELIKPSSPAKPLSVNAVKLDPEDSELHKSELMQALSMSPPMEATVMSGGAPGVLPADAPSQDKPVVLDSLDDAPSSPQLDIRSAVVHRRLAALSASKIHDLRETDASAPGLLSEQRLLRRTTQQAQLASADAFTNLSGMQPTQSIKPDNLLNKAIEHTVPALSSVKNTLKPARRLATAAVKQQEPAIVLQVQQAIQRPPEGQTAAAAASDRRHAGAVKEQEIIRPVQKPQLPIDVIVHWFDAWQLEDLTYGPPDAALLDLV